VVETVCGAIAKVKRIPRETVSATSTFDELGIDSLDGFDILFELENAFEVTIPDEAARQIHSVPEAVEGISRLLGQPPPPPTG
jgi:acyl carrier protein